MVRYRLVCLLVACLSWGQATSLTPVLAAQKPAKQTTDASKAAVSEQSQQAKTTSLALDAPLITISGFCDQTPAEKTADSNCKTVITRAQFEKVIQAVQPRMPARARREFALRYANALVMAKRAEEMGLDKGPNYEEQMKVARIEVLSKELNKVIQEKASQFSDKDIEDYYNKNTARFEKAEMDRIYVPKKRQTSATSDQKLSDAERQERSQESESTMKEEAENLRARAVAGEDFTKLQVDAYQAAGIKSGTPNTSIGIRRISLPPNQASVMDLKPGEISSVLADPNGYVIYKVKTKDNLSLDQARAEIKATLRAERLQDEMRRIQDSAIPALDESYFHSSQAAQDMMSAREQAKPVSGPYSGKPDQ